jgi:hypothetical protein
MQDGFGERKQDGDIVSGTLSIERVLAGTLTLALDSSQKAKLRPMTSLLCQRSWIIGEMADRVRGLGKS